jgi:hypothetical protein
VEEYAAQHAPRSQRQLSDEARQNLTVADQVSVEGPAPASGEGRPVFGGVNQVMAKLSGNRLSPKTFVLVGGSLLVVLIILLSVKQCDTENEDAPASVTGGAATSVERQLLFDSPPDSYLVKPGVIEVGK